MMNPTMALDLGYSDQAHFARDFKAVIGPTPATYAKSAAQPPRSGSSAGAALAVRARSSRE